MRKKRIDVKATADKILRKGGGPGYTINIMQFMQRKHDERFIKREAKRCEIEPIYKE